MLASDAVQNFPAAPGVYIMKGSGGVVLYVGKAKNLKGRVRSYFSASRDSRYQIQFLMARVATIEFIVTDTEKEALILENTLIKQHRPKYNFNLRDDKTYFSLRMDPTEPFPRLTIIRRVAKDGARYFGPYSSATSAREVLKELYKIFPLRHYPLESCRRRNRPCLFYQIRQCSGPCHGLISVEDYAALAEGAALFLAGKSQDLFKLYRQRMAEAAMQQRYEEAGKYRDLLNAIAITVEKQKMVSQGGDQDVLGFYRQGNQLELALLFIRGGNLIGSRSYTLSWELDDAEGIASFLNEYYNREVFIPEEVLLPLRIAEPEALGELLAEKRGKKVAITCPSRGTRLELVNLAGKNAATASLDKERAKAGSAATLQELQEMLQLAKLPRRIECYDISNIQGEQAVGSRVSFYDGKPDKANYRHYRIKTVAQADDFGMMQEVLSRRFISGKAEVELPDLIVVDGGIGQLNVLLGVLAELGVTGVAAAGLAKGRVTKGMTELEVSRSAERVFLPGRKNPVILRQNSAPLLLLARIRDEAHRFAITYHRKVRGKASLSSVLDRVPGIGAKRKQSLLKHFGSLKKLQEASFSELAAAPGMNAALAKAVWQYFHGGAATAGELHEE